jgi:hypothetical protein
MDSWHAVFNNMLGIGMSLTADAGDNGTTDTCGAAGGVEYPASDPDVTSAGGTTALFAGGFQSEVTWNGTGCDGGGFNQGGTGGGCSSHWSVPAYQAASAPFLCGGMRMVPDVALNASIGQNIFEGGSLFGEGGTSIVAPELAGFFAQENAYLLANNGQGPFGEANVGFYSSKFHFTPHNPYYDVTSGCQGGSGGVTGNCAGPGFDLATGWGSFNALQMAWQFNWNYYPGVDLPGFIFTAPTTDQWYNSDRLINWTVTDPTGSGIAGSTARDGFDPGDPTSHATPQHSFDAFDPFYRGPEEGTNGTVSLSSLGQGQHTVYVRAWNNMGQSNLATYGPVGYDTITPNIDSVTLSPASPTNAASITTSATADDPGCGTTGSCVDKIFYYVNSATDGTDSGTWTTLGSTAGASGSLTWSTAGLADGKHLVSANPQDVAGNVLTYAANHNTARVLTLDTTAPVTTASLAGTAAGGGTFLAPVTVTLHATDNLSGVARTIYHPSGSAVTTYTTPFTVSGVGPHTVTFRSFDKAGNVESEKAITFTIVSVPVSSTRVTQSANPTAFGQTVTFTATVAPLVGSGIPTGTVTFKDGATTLGSRALAGGSATLTTSALAAGAHSMTVVYGGDSSFGGSTSAALSHTVNRATTTTRLAGSANPSAFGQAVTFSVTVNAVAPGAGIPTGSVTFKDGATVLGTVALVGGHAGLSTSALSVANHVIVAIYMGSGSFNASAAGLHQIVYSKVTLASSANPSAFGQTVNLTATVSPAPASGTVTFKDGATVLGSAAVNGGVAPLHTSTLAVGVHSITASFSAGGVSAPFTQTVNRAATTTRLASSANPSTAGQTVTFSVTVNAVAPGAGVPTGSVTFKDGTTVLGTMALVGGHASFSTSALSVANHTILAIYGGSGSFSASAAGMHQVVAA